MLELVVDGRKTLWDGPPADGLPPYELDGLIGRRLEHVLLSDQDITFEDVEPAEELTARGVEQA